MEEKINIANILRNKPVNTKLYSPLFGDVYFSYINMLNHISVLHHDIVDYFCNDGRYKDYDEAELMLFPSKLMRDWSKFAWKKGDVLQKNSRTQVIFDSFVGDTYEVIRCKYFLKVKNGNEEFVTETNVFINEYFKASEEQRQCYINKIEEHFGGKLNLETLEIEKSQLEFKDGDIVVAEEDNYYDKVIFIAAIKDDIVSKALINVRYEDYEVHYNEYRFGRNRSLRLATDSEKQQLFDALAKEGKAWDAEKKQIVDLKPKVYFKPFDKVVVRNTEDSIWQADFFSHIDVDNRYACVGATWSFCIPYNEETAKLIGTTKDIKD